LTPQDDVVFRQAMFDTLSGPADATELVTTGGGSSSSSNGSNSTVTLQSALPGRRLQEAGSRLQRQPARHLSAATPAVQVHLLFYACIC
jgi:hypothetical protein